MGALWCLTGYCQDGLRCARAVLAGHRQSSEARGCHGRAGRRMNLARSWCASWEWLLPPFAMAGTERRASALPQRLQ